MDNLEQASRMINELRPGEIGMLVVRKKTAGGYLIMTQSIGATDHKTCNRLLLEALFGVTEERLKHLF